MNEPLLTLEGLDVALARRPEVRAVEGVGLTVNAGEAVALVGESGCGKSVTAYSILDLHGPGLTPSGRLRFAGREFALGADPSLRALRGREISMIFQDPLTSLNPVLPVGRQLEDVLRQHTDAGRRQRRTRVEELLRRVGIPAPDRVARSYPFELSGGMRQRVLIAMAISCGPKLLIADEPTTALDATVQAQIMDLLRTLMAEEGLAVLFISHDLGLVAEFCRRVYVMYAGKVVETGAAQQVLDQPQHPYTRTLADCVAALGRGAERLATVPGTVPRIDAMPPGCRFAPRCSYAVDACHEVEPVLHPGAAGATACIRHDELPAWDGGLTLEGDPR